MAISASQVEGWIEALASMGNPAGYGGVWTEAQRTSLESMSPAFWNLATIVGTEGNDYMTRHFNSDGDHAMYGLGGDDYMMGNQGNNAIYAGAGNDEINGFTGDDFLEAGAGDDLYHFQVGYGHDTINNSGGGNDTLYIAPFNPSELWFRKSGDHLTIGLIGRNDQVTVNNWFSTGDYKVDTIIAGDFTITENQVALMVQAMATLGAPAGVNGRWSEDQLNAMDPIITTYWRPNVQ